MTATLSLSNPRQPSLAPIEAAALADTGSVFLCIPEHVRLQLKLEVLEEREVKLADGSRITCPYAGPVIVRFKNRTGCVGALVLGEQVLLGAIPLEDMDLVVNPRRVHEESCRLFAPPTVLRFRGIAPGRRRRNTAQRHACGGIASNFGSDGLTWSQCRALRV